MSRPYKMRPDLPQRAQFGEARLLPDGFHDHGAWKGPCSVERHAVIRNGLPAKPDEEAEPWGVSFYRAPTSTVLVGGQALCLCCRGVILLLALSLASTARADDVLPAPPVDVTALARAEYQKAEQDFADGHLDAAERELEAAWRLQKSPAIKFDLALVKIRQAEAAPAQRKALLLDASMELYVYFGMAPPAVQDTSNEQAKAMLRKIARMLGHSGRSGRQYAAAAIARMRANDFDVSPELSTALDETQDAALWYWMVLDEFRLVRGLPGTKRHERALSVRGLERLQDMLKTYFNGASDLQDVHDARRLYEEITDEIDRSKKLTVRR